MDSAVLDDDRIVIFALPTYLLRLIVVLHHALVGFICPRDRIIGTSYFCLFFDFIDLSLLLENWILVHAVNDLKVFESWDFIDVRKADLVSFPEIIQVFPSELNGLIWC